jgi:hypothetical protein
VDKDKVEQLQEHLRKAWSLAYQLKMESDDELSTIFNKVVEEINEVELLLTNIKNNKPS